MSNGILAILFYLLLIIVEFPLKIVYCISDSVFTVFKLLLQTILDVKMTETSKKRKRKSGEQPNQTVATRSMIGANWQKLLSSNLIMDNKTEKPPREASDDRYTGTFRRDRRKKSKTDETPNSVQNNLQSLKINNEKTVLTSSSTKTTNEKAPNKTGEQKLTKFIAMDCEMVGIGYEGNDHMLARVSLVNKFGDCVYDKFVKPREKVQDYRTEISGVRKEDLLNGEDFVKVQKDVADILKGRILVGHSLKNDLSVLFLSHPKRNIRDTSRYKPFRKITKGSTPSLKRLAKEVLSIDIQHGEHSSVEDARAAMQLYCTVAKDWEKSMSQKRGSNYTAVSDM